MQIGMIGLGRMGANMVRRLLRDGHECVVNDRSPDAVNPRLMLVGQGKDRLCQVRGLGPDSAALTLVEGILYTPRPNG